MGTTGCRSILFDGNLEIIAEEYEEYGLITPKENYVEQNAENWWEMTLRTAEKAIEKSGINGEKIEGISISSQGIAIVPVDENLTPIYNAISWLDTRAESETMQIKKDFGEENIFTLTGKPIISAYTLPKLIWLKNNIPQVFDKAWKFLMPMDFLIAKFTGTCVTDYSMASGTLMYDIKNFCWSQDILNFYGIEEEKLPKIVGSGSKAGFVLPEVAQRLGLKNDCVVAVGAQDQKCAAFGAGLKEGVVTVSLGTAAAITKLWSSANTDENQDIGWSGYVDKDSFVTEGVISTAGTCLRWIRDMLFKDEQYDIINREAKQSLDRGSSLLFYPSFSDGTGTFYGINMATNRGDFALAVMEGVAFQMRIILEAMNAYETVTSLVLFGGGAKSDLWPSIIANVTGLEIKIPETYEAAGAGAAMLAAKAVGEQLQPLKIVKSYLPKNTEEYNNKFSKYRDIARKLWE